MNKRQINREAGELLRQMLASMDEMVEQLPPDAPERESWPRERREFLFKSYTPRWLPWEVENAISRLLVALPAKRRSELQ